MWSLFVNILIICLGIITVSFTLAIVTIIMDTVKKQIKSKLR